MQGLPAEAMQAWPVERSVNRSSAEGVALIAPLRSKAEVYERVYPYKK